ncbi:hypothetical protein [Nocardia transvalensis]|uniref:hypothetical protein n=1 Tax=Nocardia transvalensis TaxID=37333 RepID=UPI00189618E3|nr:hypothetical protein [Nocardia transvalensis]MBF6333570.1 hypothetical protein [Nocardia transvalensis]
MPDRIVNPEGIGTPRGDGRRSPTTPNLHLVPCPGEDQPAATNTEAPTREDQNRLPWWVRLWRFAKRVSWILWLRSWGCFDLRSARAYAHQLVDHPRKVTDVITRGGE